MAANTAPIFSLTGQVSSDSGTAMAPTFTTSEAADAAGANAYLGTSANAQLVFTAGAEGSYIGRLRFKAKGTNVSSVARIYLNNGATNGTATNNSFFGEVSLPATTAVTTAATTEVDYNMGFALNAGYKIYVGLGFTVVAGWVCTPVAGDY